MTARPQDVALLELIDRYWDLAFAEGKEGRAHDTENGDAQECRYQIGKALASAQAREDELRAEVERLRASARSAGEAMGVEAEARADAEWKVVQLAEEVLKSRERAERLEEALRERRDWFETQAKSISKGNGSSWDLMQVRDQRDLCDAALSTNAATQTGETT